MAKVEIYSSPFCGHCARAKRILSGKGVAYVDYDIMLDDAKRIEMTERTGGRTSIPQVFIDGVLVGGADDLAALDKAGKLEALLQSGG